MRVALGALRRFGKTLVEMGSYEEALEEAVPWGELNEMMARRLKE